MKIAKLLSAVLVLTSFTFSNPVLLDSAKAAGVANPGATSTSLTSLQGSYIIDVGYMTPGATSQTIAQGIKPYGLVYALVKAKIPVQWVINPNKTSVTSVGKAFDQTKGNDGIDFNFTCTSTNKNYKTGAFIVTKDFASAAASIISTWTAKGVVVDGPCTNELAANTSIPVYSTIKSWPRTVLDAQNGAVAVKYFDNAEIPQGSLTDPNNPPAYRFASPDQLTPCDDMYVMPHADPTFATHKNLINFIKAGGDFYASCHAVSVIENMVDPAAPTVKVMNLLATDGLVNYDNHVQGTTPYALYDTGTVSALFNLTTLRSGDPIAQFYGRTDAAQQQGSEQIFMPDRTRTSAWRPTTQVVVYSPNQADKVAGTKTLGPAASVLYGPAYGNSSYGQVMYVGGHSSAKGTTDDVSAQRLFFNFQLMASVTGSATPTDADRTPTVTITTPAPSTLSPGDEVSLAGSAIGGSGNYRYTWSSSCYNSIGTKLASGGTFSSANSNATTFTAPVSGGVSNCNLTLTVVDTCGRFAFGYQTFSLAPVADIKVAQSVASSSVAGSNLTYTITVTNNGITQGTTTNDGATAGSVTYKSAIPAGTTYVSITQPSSGSCSFASGQISCNFGDMADEQVLTFTFTVNPSAAGTITSAVSVSTTSLDGNLTNNKDSDSTTITEPSASQVQIEKYPATQQVSSNGVAAFRLTVKNSGNQDLTNISIKDTFSSGKLECERAGVFYFGTSASPAYDTITALAKGDTWRASCTLTGVTGSGTNEFQAIHASFTGGNPSTSVNFTVANSLSLVKTVTMVSKKVAHVLISIMNKVSATSITNMIFADIFPTGTKEYETAAGVKNSASLSSYSMSGAAGTVQGVIASEKFGDYTAGTNYGSLTGNGGNGWSGNWSFATSDTSSSSVMKISQSTYNKNGTTAQKTTISKEENSFRITATKGKTYSLTRNIQLKTANKAVSVFFECVSDASSTVIPPSIKVELGDQTLGTVDCPISRQTSTPLTIDASKITGVGTNYGNVALKLSTLDGTTTTTTSNIFIDDIYVVSGLLAADQFSVTNSYFGLTSAWTIGSNGGLSKNFSTSTSTMGTSMKQSSSSSNTYSMSNTFTLDPTKYDTSTATVSFKMTTLQSGDQIDVYRDATKVATITSTNHHACSNKCGNGTSSYDSETVSIPFSGTAVIKFVTKYTNNSGYIDDVVLTASALGSIDSGGLTGVSLADVIAKLKTISLSLNKEIQLAFDMAVDSPWTLGPDMKGFVNVSTITSSLNPSLPTYAMDYYTIPTTDVIIEKSDTSTVVTAGNTTKYTYKLTNTGSLDVVIDGISDPGCGSGANALTRLTKNGVSSSGTGITDSLTAGSTWTYSCITPVLTTDTDTTITVDFTDTNGDSDFTEDNLPITVPNAALQVTVSPSTKSIYRGGDVTYTYSVKNTGNISLSIDSVVGSNCVKNSTSALGSAYLYGDGNSDGYIEVGDTWVYQCRTTAINANQTGQTAVATGTNNNYGTVISVTGTSATYSVTVVDKPTITLTKQVKDGAGGTPGSSISVGPSNNIYYVYSASVDSGTVTSVVINDTGCRVDSSIYTGDTDNDHQLDSGETWQFTCNAGTLAVSETSTGSAGGKDALNNRINSSSVENTVEVLSPELLIEIKPENLYVLKGNSNKYTYVVKNIGGLPFTSLTAGDSNCPTLQNSFNGKTLAVGGTLSVTCTVSNLTSDLTSTFTLTGNYSGGSLIASPSVVKVFVINPTFEIKKFVKAYPQGTNLAPIMASGFTDTTTAVTASTTDSIIFRYEVKASTGTGATSVAGLNSLFLKTFNDPDCVRVTPLVDGNGYNLGDTNGSGYIDPSETWAYVCQGVPALSVYKAPGSAPLLMASPVKFKASASQPTFTTYALKSTAPTTWSYALGDPTTSTVQITVISSLDDPNAINPILQLSSSTSVTVTITDPGTGNYTLTYDGNGNTGGSAPAPQTTQNGSNVTVSGNTGTLTKDGYVFSGWNTRPDGSGSTLNPGTVFVMPAGNFTLYAIWTSTTTYTITYDGNGNTGGAAPVDPGAYLANANATVKANSGTLTLTGYTFTGWNTGSGGSGNHYAASGSATLVMPSNNVILYAEWVADALMVSNAYSVTYDGNSNTSGSVPTDSTTYNTGDPVTVKANTGTLSRSGYTLSSWNTLANGNGTSYSTSGSATFNIGSANVTLYAIWTANSAPSGGGGAVTPTYTIKYDLSGATGGTSPLDPNGYAPGQNVTVLPNGGGLTRTGYTFNGWSTAPNGGGTTYSASGTANFLMGNSNITLYPVWIPAQSNTVTYNGNGSTAGSVPVDPNGYTNGGTVNVKPNSGNLYQRGYTFNGWNTSANGTGTSYSANGSTTFILGNSSVTLYAQWKALPAVTITYNAGSATGGSMPNDTNKYYQLDVAKIQTNIGNLQRAGYKFVGWNTAADGTGTVYPATGNAVLVIGTSNVNLYPEWEKIAAPGVKIKQGTMKFKVYFGMNSVIIDSVAKKNIKEHFILLKSKLTSKSKVTVTVEGWVQPNNPPGNITYLSTNRAKNVTSALKALGLKGLYRLSFPGLAPQNDAKSRYAEVVFTWTYAK